MASTEMATIDSVVQANRYLSGLGGRVGFGEALRRVRAKSSAPIGEKLQGLERFVSGDGSESPSPELVMIGEVVRHAPAGTDIGRAIGEANTALSDARNLADDVRGGLPGDLAYAGLLLVVASLITILWISQIAPRFDELFGSMNASLPPLSQAMVDFPWAIFALIALLGAVLVVIVIGTRRLAIRIETIGPLAAGWMRPLLGRQVCAAHERWRTVALARAWSAGGLKPLEAVQHAARSLHAGDGVSGELAAAISLATDLEAADVELDYQGRESIEAYRNVLELRRAIAFRFLQIATAVLVGFIVLALYLPIFKMGAIV